MTSNRINDKCERTGDINHTDDDTDAETRTRHPSLPSCLKEKTIKTSVFVEINYIGTYYQYYSLSTN